MKIVVTRSHNFKGIMHEIRSQLWLHPGPYWGSSQHSPEPLAEIWGSYL